VNADIARAKADGNRKTFERVFLLYTELRGTSPIGACNLDPTQRRNGVSFSGIEFLTDVDLCVKATLRSHEYEKFFQLVEIELQDLSGEYRSEALRAIGANPVLLWRLTQRLGRSFAAKGLDPIYYFKTIKRTKRDEQPRVRTATFRNEEHENPVTSAHAQHSTDFGIGEFENGYGFGIIESESYE